MSARDRRPRWGGQRPGRRRTGAAAGPDGRVPDPTDGAQSILDDRGRGRRPQIGRRDGRPPELPCLSSTTCKGYGQHRRKRSIRPNSQLAECNWTQKCLSPPIALGGSGLNLCSAVSYFSTLLGSIIGAGWLSFRVRDGSGRFPAAMAAVTLCQIVCAPVCLVVGWCFGGGVWLFDCVRGLCGCEFCVVVSFRPVSASSLHTIAGLLGLVYRSRGLRGALSHLMGEKPGLGEGFPLRCFQRLSCPNVAIQRCPWWDNWWTRGSSVPVLSY